MGGEAAANHRECNENGLSSADLAEGHHLLAGVLIEKEAMALRPTSRIEESS